MSVDRLSRCRRILTLLVVLSCATVSGQESSQPTSIVVDGSGTEGVAAGEDGSEAEVRQQAVRATAAGAALDGDQASAEPPLEVTMDDVQVQGEYAALGRPGTTPAGAHFGLQVVALGDHRFRGVLLPGGLPGNGWNRRIRIPVRGQAEGDQLRLTGDDYQIVVRDGRADVTHVPSGASASLIKVQRRSRYAGLSAPDGAIVLFDGQDASAWKNARVRDGLLQVGTELIPKFRNYHLHLEFQLPYMPKARGQGRANSGVYLQSRYEVQILDSFGLEGAFNECAALYRQRAPDLNMAFPPMTWQTYDITFRAPIFDACGNKRCHARITVLHNGVAVHDNVPIVTKTGAGKPEGSMLLPIKLQNHGNPVQFRNIWLVQLR